MLLANDIVEINLIGYEGLTLEAFIAVLHKNGIERIIDVRKNPISRKKGFSKKPLSMALGFEGIEYVHVPEVGIPSSMRQSLNNQDDYDELFDRYEDEILPNCEEAISHIISMLEEKNSALMCFEQSSLQCHRFRLGKHIKKELERDGIESKFNYLSK